VQIKPQEESAQQERSKVEDIRGSPLGVATLEEMVDDNHAIISSSIGPEYYVNIMSFVDKVRGCTVSSARAATCTEKAAWPPVRRAATSTRPAPMRAGPTRARLVSSDAQQGQLSGGLARRRG